MTGTIANPIKYADVMVSPKIIAGDTLILRGGAYPTLPSPWFNGTQAAPITIKAYPGERAILNGNFSIDRDWLIFEGIEFTFSGWTSRESAEAGSSPPDIPYVYANLRGNNNKYIGCIFHDLRGCLWYTIGGEMHDCLSYFHGWQGTDRKHGHAYYIHNGAIPKKMKNCIGFDSFGYGIALYSASEPLDNVAFTQCAMFGSGRLPLGSGDNYNLHIGGEAGVSATNISLTRCTTVDGLRVRIGYIGGAEVTQVDNFFDDATLDCVLVHPSEVITGRGNIIVYNFVAQAESVTVNVSTILSAGASYKLHNARDFYGDIATGTVAGNGTITIDMRAVSHSIGTPVALGAIANGFPYFGAFVLEPA